MSNTPLLHVAQDLRIDALVVQVDLWSGRGDLPKNLEEVYERAKDIQYPSKHRLAMETMRHLEAFDPTWQTFSRCCQRQRRRIRVCRSWLR